MFIARNRNRSVGVRAARRHLAGGVARATTGAALLVAATLAVACAVAVPVAVQAQVYDWKGRVVKSGAKVVVNNPATPLLSGNSAQVSPLWRAPTPQERSRKGEWSEPSGVVAAPEGVFVSDARALVIYKLSHAGAWTHNIGKPGNEVGQLSLIGGFAVVRGELLVPVRSRMEVFGASDGKHRRTVALPVVTFAIASQSGGDLLLSGVQGLQKMSAAGVVTPVRYYTDSIGAPSEKPTRCSVSGIVNWQLVSIDCYLPRMTIANEGGVTREIRIERDTARATAADEAQCRRSRLAPIDTAKMAADARALLMRSLEGCRTKREIRGVQVDPVSGLMVIWKQNPESDARTSARVDVLSKEGVYLFSHEFADTWTAFTVNDSRLVALVRNTNTGEVGAAAFQIRIPAAALAYAATAAAVK